MKVFGIFLLLLGCFLTGGSSIILHISEQWVGPLFWVGVLFLMFGFVLTLKAFEPPEQVDMELWKGKQRDPARIPEMLDKLRECWENSTDLRLGQLVTVLASTNRPNVTDPFYTEDDVMLAAMEAFLANRKRENHELRSEQPQRDAHDSGR